MPLRDLRFSDRDEYNRQSTADKIQILLESDIPISPMIIDGKWGQGKTEFCVKLINHIKGHVKCIYIDAYKSDHIDDPLLTIFSAIIAEIDEPEERSNLLDKAAPVFAFGLKTLGKAAVAWGLKQDTDDIVSGFETAIQETGDAMFNAIAKKMVTECQEEEQNLVALKSALEVATDDRKLVIIIDELDRCRPSFAVEILEKIKHVFDIPSLTFILVTNSDQLKAAVNNTYGEHVDAEDYINKFVAYTVRLNQYNGSSNQRTLNSISHFRTTLALYSELSYLNNSGSLLHKLLLELIEKNSLSLRQVERLVLRLRVFEKLYPNGLLTDANSRNLVLITVIFIDCFQPNSIDKIERSELTPEGILQLISISFNSEYERKPWLNYFITLHKLWGQGATWESYAVGKKPERDVLDRFSNEHFAASTFIDLMEHLYIEAIKMVRLGTPPQES